MDNELPYLISVNKWFIRTDEAIPVLLAELKREMTEAGIPSTRCPDCGNETQVSHIYRLAVDDVLNALRRRLERQQT